MKKLIIMLLLAAMLLTSCVTEGNHQKDHEAQPSVPALTPETTSEETKPELPPKREFDKAEVYKHVFEEHSEKIENFDVVNDDPEDFGVSFDNKDALVALGTIKEANLPGYELESWNFDTYVVKNASSYSTGNCDKYSVALYGGTDLPSYYKVTHDYFEAYIDVMLENLTFEECERKPTVKEDVAYVVGAIGGAEQYYTFASDGYIYYGVNRDGSVKSYKSNEKADIAYLTYIAHASYCYMTRPEQVTATDVYYGRYFGEKLEPVGKCTYKTVTTREGDTVTYTVDEKGTAYRLDLLGSLYYMDGWDTASFFTLFQTKYSHCYKDAEKNGLFDSDY